MFPLATTPQMGCEMVHIITECFAHNMRVYCCKNTTCWCPRPPPKRKNQAIATVVARDRVSDSSLYLNKVKAKLFLPGEQFAIALANDRETSLQPNTPIEPEEKLDVHKRGLAGVRNTRSVWLLSFESWVTQDCGREQLHVKH